ncbi:MAG TPA: hypothetical protein DEA28_03725 [Firmicutes bacterium]|nr:hypothetical protein [Bacillota bacterium]
MKNIKNIFFDFNGTILDDLKLSYELLLNLMDKQNLKHISLNEYREVFGFPVKNYYEKLGFKFPGNSFHEASIYFINEYKSRWKKETELETNCRNILNELKKDGYRLYILSASELSLLNEQLSFFKIKDFFDGISASKDTHAKGKIDYGRDFIKANNIDTSKSILLGDTIHDAEVAKALNMDFVLFTNGHNSKKILSHIGPTVDNYVEFYKYIKKMG